jgi:hypothetical protein
MSAAAVGITEFSDKNNDNAHRIILYILCHWLYTWTINSWLTKYVYFSENRLAIQLDEQEDQTVMIRSNNQAGLIVHKTYFSIIHTCLMKK